jgi:hypothetical protein
MAGKDRMTAREWIDKRAEAILSAYTENGYVTDSGAIDSAKWRASILEIVMKAKVVKKDDRSKKAITRGDLTKLVFPSLVTPEGFIDADDPFMAEITWKEIDQKTWQQVSTSATSNLQRMVGLHMGNGYTMCRTKIGTNKIDAVYVTDNFALISEDLSRPDNLALQRKAQGNVRNREMLMIRHPKQAKHILSRSTRARRNWR